LRFGKNQHVVLGVSRDAGGSPGVVGGVCGNAGKFLKVLMEYPTTLGLRENVFGVSFLFHFFE
jgi:hypothetical protein